MPPVITLFALLAGLVPGILETGQVDPGDWLLPCGAALVFLLLIAGPMVRWRIGWTWALVALPALLFCATIGTRLPSLDMFLLGATLALVALLMSLAGRYGPPGHRIAAGFLLAALIAFPSLVESLPAPTITARSTIGVLTALPLQGGSGAERGADALRTVGLRSPVWQALESHFALLPLDMLDAGHLQALDGLLLGQPRRLSPAELAALDAWVREGGHVVILADPLLRWPDPRPLAHPRRAPLTSLLDPLLGHWGLTLLPASSPNVERRAMKDGSLLQLAGASRFSIAPGAACVLNEHGLIAHCRIGGGRAVLVADADWINDDLWTLAPETPLAERRWTSDAIPILSQMLGSVTRLSTRSWLIGERALFAGMRWALGLLLLLALIPTACRMLPRFSQVGPSKDRDQMQNGAAPGPNTG